MHIHAYRFRVKSHSHSPTSTRLNQLGRRLARNEDGMGWGRWNAGKLKSTTKKEGIALYAWNLGAGVDMVATAGTFFLILCSFRLYHSSSSRMPPFSTLICSRLQAKTSNFQLSAPLLHLRLRVDANTGHRMKTKIVTRTIQALARCGDIKFEIQATLDSGSRSPTRSSATQRSTPRPSVSQPLARFPPRRISPQS